ncbi:MAG: bifunctional enoyl-CoA hydratase/phosphate acetyltransferase [Candidatus Berkiella sp.]
MKKLLDILQLEKNFLDRCRTMKKITIAVAHPCSDDSLKGVVDAAHVGLIDPILIGPINKINAIADALKIDISSFNVINVPHSNAAAEMAVSLVHQGKAEAIMKGSLHTDELMKEVVKREGGLRTERRISHVFIMARETYHKPFIITDAAINISPDLMTKRDILQNAIDLMLVLNKDMKPKVGILSAVETINPAIQSTIDAACLCKMAERGQITGAIVDGPFAYDNIISEKAAKTKNIHSSVTGDVDIYLVPNLEAGNLLAKQLAFLTNALCAGMILGAKVPIVLTSRSDGVQSRISSCAIAVMMVNAKIQLDPSEI